MRGTTSSVRFSHKAVALVDLPLVTENHLWLTTLDGSERELESIEEVWAQPIFWADDQETRMARSFGKCVRDRNGRVIALVDWDMNALYVRRDRSEIVSHFLYGLLDLCSVVSEADEDLQAWRRLSCGGTYRLHQVVHVCGDGRDQNRIAVAWFVWEKIMKSANSGLELAEAVTLESVALAHGVSKLLGDSTQRRGAQLHEVSERASKRPAATR